VTLLLKPADFQTMVALLREQITHTPGAAEITPIPN
jgi:hypothetical protein